MKKNLFIFTMLLSGCATTSSTVDWSTYQVNSAWDTSLLVDMECEDMQDSNSCFKLQNVSRAMIGQTFEEIYASGNVPAECLAYIEAQKTESDVANDVLDFMENNSIPRESDTVKVYQFWVSSGCPQ